MKHLLIFLTILIVFSCKKDKNKNLPSTITESAVWHQKKVDTLKPNPYLPAFPGSWWKYLDNNGVIITYTTEPNYVKDSYLTMDYSTLKYVSTDPAYVPVYMGRKIWGRKEHKDTHSAYFPPGLIPIVSDSLKVGTVWTTNDINTHSHNYSRIITKDTAIVIAGKTYSPTIVVELSTGGDFPPYFRYSLEYYTKEIGMVRAEFMGWNKPDSITSYMNIKDYHINK